MYTTSKPLAAPVTGIQRIQALDVIRGVALLGILLMNITGFGLPFAYEDPSLAGGDEGLNLLVFQITSLFFEGTMRGLFTMLFGAGFILLTARLENKGLGITTADVYYRRVLWLLLFGVIHSYVLLWPGDILYHYGLFGLFLFPLRNTKARYLCMAGLLIMGIAVWEAWGSYKDTKEEEVTASEYMALRDQGVILNAEQEEAVEAWGMMAEKQSPERVAEETEVMRQGYVDIFKHLAPYSRFWESKATYKFIIWDILSFLLLGMALFKWRVLTGERSLKFYAALLLIGYGVGLAINYYELQLIQSRDFFVIDMVKAGLTYEPGRLFMTLGHIGAVMLFVKSEFFVLLKKGLAAVGRMALTNYLMHTVVCIFFFYGFGFGFFGKLQRYELYYVVFAVWAFQLILSPVWLKYFKYGPIEWLWRSLTYKKVQDFRR
ncbi:DUF418 domain-containing protein [Robertkochia flava]|uniref:DUF418 domain-containing protein n=1 Tax=Robertkochia flava TaxID=3447986 RepID=UPI001CCDD63C|nr:DUF418 domain-containing protein [Robertkochia marina]